MTTEKVRTSAHSDDTARKGSLRVERRFTTPDVPWEKTVEWTVFKSSLRDDRTGEVLWEAEVEAPTHYTQSAVDIIASKYLRKAGVPQVDEDGNPILDENGEPVLGGETSIRQVVHRLAGCWADWGRRLGYFDEENAEAFYQEVAWMLVHQYFAPNSPQWFNTGLYFAYGIDGTSKKRFYFDPEKGEVVESTSRYQRPEPMACYIGRILDNLTEESGIYEFLAREGRIFQAGAGSGANFSSLRAAGEPLSGGGVSSGMMSFLKVFDRSAGAIKSGGTTRRAAKMVVVDVDHPEIEEFIWWKANEEKKVAALVAAGYDSDWRGEAYQTVSGQNSNNSVSVSHAFMDAVESDRTWALTARTTGEVMKEVRARDLWRQIAEAAWQSADPGIQFNGTMNDWHTVPHVGPIRASNPCSEYLSIDDSACNLASLRLTAFLDQAADGSPVFRVDDFRHAVRLGTLVLEISVAMAQLPDDIVAENTYKLRNLGLGYADLGSLLMRMGLPYDSDEGRAVAASITSLMTATAYEQSAQLAAHMGPYEFYNADNHLRVIRNHRAAHNGGEFEGLRVTPQVIDQGALPTFARPIFDAGVKAWDAALLEGELHGYRNSQVTVLAPTGTISFAMGCDTTGIEPDYSLVKIKKLAGGGSMTIVNGAVDPALSALGYSEVEREAILSHILDSGDIVGAPGLDPAHLPVFDTAVGERAIRPEGHVLMLGATAPFLSGAASKTVNLPGDATVEDLESIHMLAYRQGVKCIAIYRDGSKLSQVLSAKSDEPKEADKPALSYEDMVAKVRQMLSSPPEGVSPESFYAQFGLKGAPRFKLSSERLGRTWEIKVGGTKVFLRTGEYEDGSLGEIFIDLAKEGATLRGVISCFAMAVSHGLQTGIPLRKLVDQFTFQTFEPRGIVERHPHIKMANSIIDAVFRVLAAHYLHDDSLAQVKFDTQPKLLDVEDDEVNGKAADRVIGDFAPKPVSPAPAKEPTPVNTGETCTACGGQLVMTGTCRTCTSCGSTDGGCS